MLDAAINIAVLAHMGQKDKNGYPYILHPLRVMLAVKEHGEEAMAAAVLHDVLEDTAVTHMDLLNGNIPYSVAEVVSVLTRGNSESYQDYLYRIVAKAALPRYAMAKLIKIADIEDNLREPFPFGDSMRRKYKRALSLLRSMG